MTNEKESRLKVVGIGASAGGLEALQVFFQNMPVDTGLSFVIVQHLSPDYKSLMDELLARFTQLAIYVVEDGQKVEADSIYLIPPRKNMTIYNNTLYLSDQEKKPYINLPIDMFFASLAEDAGKNAIGIILSGTGSDGTRGIKAIKEVGGMVMVQDSRSAKFDGMPNSSISTGLVDFVLSAEEMPKRLIDYLKHPLISKNKKATETDNSFQQKVSKVLKIVKDGTGMDFSYYKPNTINRRIEKRISINQNNNIEEYLNFISQSVKEPKILSKELLISVTSFFRDKEAFEIIENTVIPSIFESNNGDDQIRIWTAACATGEEAYSLAILFHKYATEHNLNKNIKIFATDIDKEAIEFAGSGIYSESIISDVPPKILETYFKRYEDKYQVTETIRKMVIFAKHDIVKDPPFSKIDLIVCRNLFIYLNNQVQTQLLYRFYFALKPDGFLFMGNSESIGELYIGFEPISTKWKIYKYKKGVKPIIQNKLIVPQIPNIEPYKKDIVLQYKPHGKKSLTALYDKIFASFLPPSVILDENYDIVHIINDINKYLKLPTGKLSLNILKMLPKDIAVSVSSLLRKAIKEKKKIVYENVRIKTEKGEKYINLISEYITDEVNHLDYYILSFEEGREIKKLDATSEKINVNEQYQERIIELEKELQYNKESLQATVEELETSNEELQSSNEELIASNEELQSTNEELQSVNEELYTVNYEHQNKIEELTQLYSDIDNLLKNTKIGTLYLDRKLIIRKVTPLVTQITNIMETDIGRPIKHIAIGDIYRNFQKDLEDVVQTLQRKETEIRDKEGNWYLMKILPYRTAENAVEGIIITLTDINEIKKAEVELKEERDLLKRVLESSPLGATIVDKNGNITYANKKAEEIFGISQEQIRKRQFNASEWEITGTDHKSIKNEKLPFSVIMKTKEPLYDYRHYIKIPGKQKRLLSINGSPLFDEKKEVQAIVFKIIDVTEKAEAENAVKESERRFRSVLENMQLIGLMLNQEGEITFVNKYLLRLTGWTKKEALGVNWFQNFLPDDNKNEVSTLFKENIFKNTLPNSFTNEIVTKKGERRIIKWNNTVHYDCHNKPLSVTSIGEDITEQVEMQNKLEENEKKYQNLFHSNRDAILIADENRAIIDANPAFEKLTGYSLKEIKGKKTSFIYADEKEFAVMGKQLKTNKTDNGFLKYIEYKKKSGETFIGETSAFQLKKENSEIYAYVGLIRDVTGKTGKNFKDK